MNHNLKILELTITFLKDYPHLIDSDTHVVNDVVVSVFKTFKDFLKEECEKDSASQKPN